MKYQFIKKLENSVEEKLNILSPTILIFPNIKIVVKDKIMACQQIVLLHAPNLEELEDSSLDWNISMVDLNFPKLKFIGDTALCYLVKLKVVILDRVTNL